VRRRPVTGQRDGGDGPGAAAGAHASNGADTARDGNRGTATLTAAPGSPGTGGPGEPDEVPRAPARRGGSRLALSNWRVRWRVLALIIVPTIAAVVLGGLRIGSAASSAVALKRTQQLAVLNGDVIRLAQSMEDERDLTAGWIADGRPTGTAAIYTALLNQRDTTDEAVQQISGDASNIGPTYSAAIRSALSDVQARISDLDHLRSATAPPAGNIPVLPLIQDYTSSIDALLTFTSLSGSGTNDTQLSSDVITLTALARAENQASQQRGILYAALIARQFAPEGLTSLQSAEAQESAAEADFQSSASLAEQQLFQNKVSGSAVDQAALEEQLAAATSNDGSVGIGVPAASAPGIWYGNMTTTVQDMRGVESTLLSSILTRSQSLQSSATRFAVIISIIVLALLVIVLLITTLVARSMIRPLRRLREDALDIAGTRLPDMVRRLSETEGSDGSVEIEPIAVSSTDEIGEVARAFDQVHREAVRLAADEAMLRGNLNAMFVNLSRRSQSLIERQISLIDSLEQGEQDSGRLSSLFRLDHLATRMRRNSENLLVLAGHEASRRWSQPVPLVDVLRAAISEIEQYERVVLNVQPGITIVGQAVNDVVHLVAELVENATTFSPEDTQVFVSGQPLTSGGVLLDITDGGVGISDSEMGHANWRLDNPPVVDVGVSRRMGLFVVGRLAARHGVRVRLRHASAGGLTALVWLPDTVAAQEGAPLGRLRRFEADDYGPSPSLSAPPAGGTGGALPTRQTGNAAAQAAAAARMPRFSPPSGTPPQPRAGTGPQPDPGRPGNGVTRGFTPPGQSPAASPQGPAPAGPGAAPAGNGFSVPFRPTTGGIPAVGTPSAPAGPGSPGPAGPGPGSPAGTEPGNGSTLGPPNGDNGVRVPAPPENGHDQRLPIFDTLESDWFRRSGTSHTAGPPPGSEASPASAPDQAAWHSPADEGWRAAETVAAPSTGTTTSAGLPRRVPRANLVPGSVGEPAADPGESGRPSRSAAEVRNRLASFQRGVREARASAPKTEEP
jgi:signal transduction histidine kinase